MQGVLNAMEFENPRRLNRWIQRASGWMEKGARHDGGIWDPKPVKLRRGQTLFRIGHSRNKYGPVPDDINLASPWWLEPETFADLAISADIVGLNRQTVARLKLSVTTRYGGEFDTVFCVQLQDSLGALRGPGNPVYDLSDSGGTEVKRIWAWSEKGLMQCFIPGLRDLHNRPTGLAEEAFRLVAKFPVQEWRAMDDAGLVIAGRGVG